MTRHLILLFPNFEKEFIVQTNASLYAVGAVLSQLDDKGNEHLLLTAAGPYQLKKVIKR